MNKQDFSISAVILTRNRPEMCRDTAVSAAHALRNMHGSVLVINNGDLKPDLPPAAAGTPIRVINNKHNMGTSARNQALESADIILMLDDDATISPDAIAKAVTALQNDTSAGAVAFRIAGAGGSSEACLLPTVFHGCACCFKASALKQINGYPKWRSYYGEEYDVAFKLYSAGFKILMLTSNDHVQHMRHPGGRDLNRIIRLNVLHNLTMWVKHFPLKYLRPSIKDTLQRYMAVARKENAMQGYRSAVTRAPYALIRGFLQRKPLSLIQFRHITLLDRINSVSHVALSKGIDSLIVAGTGKFPSLYIDEIIKHGINIPFIIDSNPCWQNSAIEGVPVITGSKEQIHSFLQQHKDAALLTGTASIPESLNWTEYALDAGMQHVWQDGWAKNAPTGTIDLLEHQPVAIMKHA